MGGGAPGYQAALQLQTLYAASVMLALRASANRCSTESFRSERAFETGCGAGGSQQASHWLQRQARGYRRRSCPHASTEDCISSTWPEGCGRFSDGPQVAGAPAPKSPIDLLPGEHEGSEGCAIILPPAVVSRGPQQPLHPPRHGKPGPSVARG